MDIVRSILTAFNQPNWPESLCWESRGAESRIYVVQPITFRSAFHNHMFSNCPQDQIIYIILSA